MRLRNYSPDHLLGRTIQDHLGTWWKVQGVSDEMLALERMSGATKGALRLELLRRCRLYPSQEEVEDRYPKLIRALQLGVGLPHQEAVSTLSCLILNGVFSSPSEAIARHGGAGEVVRMAWKSRHRARALTRRTSSRGNK